MTTRRGADKSLRAPSTRVLDYSRVIHLANEFKIPVPAAKREHVEADDMTQLAGAFYELIVLEKQLWELQGKLNLYQWQRDTADVLHVISVEQRVIELKKITEQFSTLLDQRTTFLGMLKQPYIGGHLLVAPSQQRALVGLFQEMAKSLSQYTVNTDITTWLQDVPVFNDKMTEALAQLTGMVATFSNYYESLTSIGDQLDTLKHAASK
ncbi:hypothetical protein BDF19DRAFT_464413 [Syncephalis fuscata]|nr:hypothetical protein BDF19DRAFT_464413 [Syncephalis fuscata]